MDSLKDNRRVLVNPTQIWLLAAFIVINVAFYLLSVEMRPYPDGPLISATYWAAADGQRYWGVAISLAE